MDDDTERGSPKKKAKKTDGSAKDVIPTVEPSDEGFNLRPNKHIDYSAMLQPESESDLDAEDDLDAQQAYEQPNEDEEDDRDEQRMTTTGPPSSQSSLGNQFPAPEPLVNDYVVPAPVFNAPMDYSTYYTPAPTPNYGLSVPHTPIFPDPAHNIYDMQLPLPSVWHDTRYPSGQQVDMGSQALTQSGPFGYPQPAMDDSINETDITPQFNQFSFPAHTPSFDSGYGSYGGNYGCDN